MNYVWSLLNILQIISFTIKFNIKIPDNVYVFFEVINDLLNMRAQFIQDFLDYISDSIFKIDPD
jgi:hypothetical protein